MELYNYLTPKINLPFWDQQRAILNKFYLEAATMSSIVSDKLSCIGEGACFMSSQEVIRTTEHSYKKSSPTTHGHFLPTEIRYPAYSFPARPFAWLMRDNLLAVKDAYNIDFQQEREPHLILMTMLAD